ncbi:ZIP family metal transporter [Wenzhouxiangella sp. XN24]|uniref:ZIP family metal transporter n=1 Tax=Wenzhouxiangella sp. XN24 TaxID=2713569 RepID=UPI001F0F8DCB|nr:ZIP family metal transporter [Wenzhouxiangella sp. XN24]
MLAALVTALGIFTIRRFAGWGQRNTPHFMNFAAGLLISASLLHLVPESLGMVAAAPAGWLAGFVALLLFNRIATGFLCERDPENKSYVIGLIPMIGIGIHSFVDGFIYSITFSVSLFTGYLATIGMVLHEFPEGLVTYLFLLRGGFSERRAMVLAFMAAAASTPAGMLLSYPFVSRINTPMLGTLLAISAGALLYVGASHLLPHAEQERKGQSLLAFGGGMLVAILIVLSKA